MGLTKEEGGGDHENLLWKNKSKSYQGKYG